MLIFVKHAPYIGGRGEKEIETTPDCFNNYEKEEKRRVESYLLNILRCFIRAVETEGKEKRKRR